MEQGSPRTVLRTQVEASLETATAALVSTAAASLTADGATRGGLCGPEDQQLPRYQANADSRLMAESVYASAAGEQTALILLGSACWGRVQSAQIGGRSAALGDMTHDNRVLTGEDVVGQKRIGSAGYGWLSVRSGKVKLRAFWQRTVYQGKMEGTGRRRRTRFLGKRCRRSRLPVLGSFHTAQNRRDESLPLAHNPRPPSPP